MSGPSITTPIFVIEPGDVTVRLSLAEALSSVEAIDLVDRPVGMWDGTGIRLQLAAESDLGPITVSSIGPLEEGWLKDTLADFIRRVGPERYALGDVDLDTPDLAELVVAMEAQEREWRASRFSLLKAVIRRLRSIKRQVSEIRQNRWPAPSAPE